MLVSLVITLREGLEAALVVGIIFAYLAKLKRHDGFIVAWGGISSAVVVSAVVAALFLRWMGGYGGDIQKRYEIVAMLSAVIVLTYVILWMSGQAHSYKKRLESSVAGALERDSLWSLGALVFLIVVREGIELVLFLYAAALTSTPLQTLTGTLLGISVASILGYTIYRGSRLINLRTFFTVTGMLLVVFAAGLLGKSLHGLKEFDVLPFWTEVVWDSSNLLSGESVFGTILSTVAGYDPNPIFLQVIAYLLYVVVVGWLLLKPVEYQVSRTEGAPAAVAGRVRWWAPVAIGMILVLMASILVVPALRAKKEMYMYGTDSLKGAGPPVEVTMTARRFEFEPQVLTVAPGALVNLTVRSSDVTHGLSFPGGTVPVPGGGESVTVHFIAPTKPGDYEFPCMIPCGSGHSEMKWHLKVLPA